MMCALLFINIQEYTSLVYKHRKEHIENMVQCLDKVWSDLSLPRKNSAKLKINN